MLNIVLSFDYELYLGENFLPAEEVLFKPSERLIDVLADAGVSGTFFADICSYIAHRNNGLDGYCRAFENQISYMKEKGQDVQLHIHPHWFKCVYAEGQFKPNLDYYSLQDFARLEGVNKIDEIIAVSSGELNNILGKGNECVAFRAGGLVFQPYEKEIIAALIKNGIVIDSSIAPQMNIKDGYVYTDVPKGYNNWNISANEGIFFDDKENPSLLEVPVGTIQNSLVRFVSVLPKKLRLTPGKPKGTYFGAAEKSKAVVRTTKVETLKRRLCGTSILTMDTKTADLLVAEIKSVYRQHNCRQKDYSIALIAHPKTMTDETLENIKVLIQKLKGLDNVNIVSMKQIAIERGLK